MLLDNRRLHQEDCGTIYKQVPGLLTLAPMHFLFMHVNKVFILNAKTWTVNDLKM